MTPEGISEEIENTAKEMCAVIRNAPFDFEAFSTQLKRWRMLGVDADATPLIRRLFFMFLSDVKLLSENWTSRGRSRQQIVSDAEQLVHDLVIEFAAHAQRSAAELSLRLKKQNLANSARRSYMSGNRN